VIINLDAQTRTILMLTVYTPKPVVQQVYGQVTAYTAPTDTTGGSITVKGESGEAKTFPVDTKATVMLGENAAKLSDLLVNDTVKLTVTNGTVTKIEIKATRQELTGTLKGVVVGTDSTRPSITIETGNPAVSKTFEIADWARIKRSGSDATLTLNDLKTGDQMKILVERNLVTQIEVRTQISQLTGKVSAWTAPTETQAGSITLTTESGEAKTLPVDVKAIAKIGDRTVSLNDVRPNDQVKLTVTNGVVTAISITVTREELTGMVTGVSAGTDANGPVLTIETGSPAVSKSFAIAATTVIKDAGRDEVLTVNDLQLGATVKLVVERNVLVLVEITAQPAEQTESNS
jgi:hypothetical protein